MLQSILFLVPSCPKKKTRMFIDGWWNRRSGGPVAGFETRGRRGSSFLSEVDRNCGKPGSYLQDILMHHLLGSLF